MLVWWSFFSLDDVRGVTEESYIFGHMYALYKHIWNGVIKRA